MFIILPFLALSILHCNSVMDQHDNNVKFTKKADFMDFKYMPNFVSTLTFLSWNSLLLQ
jgi:hypothetical protein